MKLPENDAKTFFSLMTMFHDFVNRKLDVLPNIGTLKEYNAAAPDEKVRVRQAFLSKRDELVDMFVEKNPRKISKKHLEIVSTWKNCVAGEFYIERMLKKYTVFIQNDSVYGVLGLHDSFDELFHKSQLPFLARTVLYPFKGRIVYDGLLQGYNIYFGGGVRKNLKEIYMTAKQNGRIVENLEGKKEAAKVEVSKPSKDWSPEFDELVKIAKKLKGGGGQPAICSPVFALVKASLDFGQAAVADPNDIDRLWDCYHKVTRSMRKVGTTLNRSE